MKIRLPLLRLFLKLLRLDTAFHLGLWLNSELMQKDDPKTRNNLLNSLYLIQTQELSPRPAVPARPSLDALHIPLRRA